MAEPVKKTEGSILLKGRRSLDLEGVLEVVSFDERGIVVKTVDGELTIEGKDLRIGELSGTGGRVCATGTVDGLYYRSESKAGGFWQRWRGGKDGTT